MIDQVELTATIEELPSGAAILAFAGEIDIATAPTVAPHFQTLADRGLADVIVDARQVSFMDSTGIHALIEGNRIVHEKGSRVVVVPSLQVRRVLELALPEPLFAARLDTMEGALATLPAPQRLL